MNLPTKLLPIWSWLNGKKTTIGMVLMFLYGGLSAVGVDVPALRDAAVFVGGIGLAHKAVKVRG